MQNFKQRSFTANTVSREPTLDMPCPVTLRTGRQINFPPPCVSTLLPTFKKWSLNSNLASAWPSKILSAEEVNRSSMRRSFRNFRLENVSPQEKSSLSSNFTLLWNLGGQGMLSFNLRIPLQSGDRNSIYLKQAFSVSHVKLVVE